MPSCYVLRRFGAQQSNAMLRPLVTFIVALFGFAPGLVSAKEAWPMIAPEELAATKSVIDADAPGEVSQWNYELDDSYIPEYRKITEYTRFKVFDPNRAEDILRVPAVAAAWSGETIEIRGRLTLPDGSSKEFGSEAMKERARARPPRSSGFPGWLNQSNDQVKENLLTVSGLERGAVVEYRMTALTKWPRALIVTPIQRFGLPVRRAEYVYRLAPQRSGWLGRSFVLNRMNGTLKEDFKQRTITFTAANVPSIVHEPMVGPLADYAMTVITSYEETTTTLGSRSRSVPIPDDVDLSLGAWAPHATALNWYERDRGAATPRVKKVAAEIAAQNPDEKARAVAVHRYVRTLYQKARAAARQYKGPAPLTRVESLDEVLNADKALELSNYPSEFLWLAVALFKEVGLDAHVVAIPDRFVCRFTPEYLSMVFLPFRAAAVKVAGQWQFSEPQSEEGLPFGTVPWRQEGYPALLALDHKQEFVTVPLTPSERSVIANVGKFALDLAGTLTGEWQRVYTGQCAAMLRAELVGLDGMKQRRVAREWFGVAPKIVELTEITLANVDDPDQPVIATAKVRWPHYAAREKDRLVFRPAVFQATNERMFSATERRYPVSFPCEWCERDQIGIVLPSGFAPEQPSAPKALDAGALFHRIRLGYDSAHQALVVTREFKSDLIAVPTEGYPGLKKWYDLMAAADQRQIVFVGHDVPMPDAATLEAAARALTADPSDSGDADKPGGSHQQR